MQELSLKSGLVCHLGAMESISAIYLDKIESPDSVPTSKSWIGKKIELHITALGKALLAGRHEKNWIIFRSTHVNSTYAQYIYR